MSRGIRLLSVFIAMHGVLFAQDEKKEKPTEIEIIRADALNFRERDGQRTYLLTGAVVLKQGDTRLFCDSAYLFNASNSAAAYGKVHINQADSVHAYSDSARYNGNTKVATLYENVRLTDRDMTLQTNYLVYHLDEKYGIYSGGGTLKNAEAILTSKTGYYYAQTQNAYFKDSVRLRHPQYSLEADTLEYNTGIEIAWFHGPTTIYNENNTVYCEDGYYATVTGEAVFNRNARMDNPPQTLLADSIYYNRETGIGKAFGNITFTDTTQQIIQFGNRANYDEINNVITATDRSVAGYIMEDDTLFISGDTIRITRDSLDRSTMVVHPNVRMFKRDFQGVCDSLYYSDTDSVIRLYVDPVLWSEETQFKGDTVLLQLRNKELHEMLFLSNGFIINEEDSLIYNQVKGRKITGRFSEGSLYKVEVQGNGESIYFGKDDQDRYLGVNKALCSDIDMYIKENKFSRISFKGAPESVFYPMQRIDPATFVLDGFSWESSRRPADRNDLFEPPSVQETDDTLNPSLERSSQNEG